MAVATANFHSRDGMTHRTGRNALTYDGMDQTIALAIEATMNARCTSVTVQDLRGDRGHTYPVGSRRSATLFLRDADGNQAKASIRNIAVGADATVISDAIVGNAKVPGGGLVTVCDVLIKTLPA